MIALNEPDIHCHIILEILMDCEIITGVQLFYLHQKIILMLCIIEGISSHFAGELNSVKPAFITADNRFKLIKTL